MLSIIQPLEFVESVMNQAKGIAEFDKLRQFFPKDYEFDQEQSQWSFITIVHHIHIPLQ